MLLSFKKLIIIFCALKFRLVNRETILKGVLIPAIANSWYILLLLKGHSNKIC